MTNQLIQINNQTYDLSHHTPMMVQYLETKVKYPNALLLYRMGDFYELFFDDAKLASQLLDITLTRRGKDKSGKEIPMAGVPFHAADSYMARMIAKGQTVVVCEQIDEKPTSQTELKKEKKNSQSNSQPNSKSSSKKTDTAKTTTNSSAKGLMRREVVRTLTAGTLTDEALFAPNQDASHTPNVVAIDITINIKKQSYQVGMSSLDISAGSIHCQMVDSKNLEQLQNEMATILARFSPSECIINEKFNQYQQTHKTDSEQENASQLSQCVRWLYDNLSCPMIAVASSDFSTTHATETLCQQFGVVHLEGLGIAHNLLAQSTVAALIHYARQTQQRQIPHVNQLVVENSEDYLILDDICQRNLEIFSSVSSGGTSLISILNKCKTAMGKRLLPQQIKRPLRNREHIKIRADAIEYLTLAELSVLQALQQVLAQIADVERISSRISLATAKPRDLYKLAESIRASQQLEKQLQQTLANENSKSLTSLLGLLLEHINQPILSEVVELLESAIVDEPPAHIRDGGMIRTGYNQQLDELTHLHDNIQDTLDAMAEKHRQQYTLPSLKVGFNKVSGFYFELPSSQAKSAPEIFVRRQTLKSCERYITDELKTLEITYLNAQSQALAKEKQLYSELLTLIAKDIADIQQLAKSLAQVDVLINWAIIAKKNQWTRPDLTQNSGELIINQGRHLVVESVIIQRQQSGNSTGNANHFVANDCIMGAGLELEQAEENVDPKQADANHAKLLLITGPNMGGKSTYMRQIALIVLLANCGSFVPASSATIGDIDRIFTRIGSADDLAGGKSTFMVEMVETAHILNLATDKSLVLMDEVGRGTSTTDGLAIAHACVNRLVAMECLTLFATHYFELTTLAEQDKRMQNMHVVASEVDGKLLLLHQVRNGFASSSFGLHVAKMAGVPIAVLEDASNYLNNHLSLNDTLNLNSNLTLDNSSEDNSSEPVNSKKQVNAQQQNNKINTVDNQHNQDSSVIVIDERQIDLFVEEKPTQSAEDLAKLAQLENINQLLATANPDEMTPRQALDWLYQLKSKL